MALTRYYEICCDTCGWTDHFVGNAAYVITQAKERGWIEAEDGKHYCDAKCRDTDKDKLPEGVIVDG